MNIYKFAGLSNSVSTANSDVCYPIFIQFKATITHVQQVSTSMLSTLAPTEHQQCIMLVQASTPAVQQYAYQNTRSVSNHHVRRLKTV